MQVSMSASMLLLTLGAVGLMVVAVEATSEVTCPDIDPISNADIHTSSQSPYKVGTVANFTCDAGFKGVGRASVTCLQNGRWSGPMPYCTTYKCKRDLSKVSKDRKCRKRCKRDSQCKGSFKRCVCDDWCGKSCFNPDALCPNLTAPANGYILANELSYGHTVTYGCYSGYTLTGPSTRRCRSDRAWSKYPPLCVPFGTCGQPGDLTTSQVAGKVIEGTNAKQGAWPWQALLIHNLDYTIDQIYNIESGFGGGSIINDEWILSAAHVFNQFPQAKIRKNWKDRFLIVVGMTRYPNRGHAIPEHIHIFEPRSLYEHPSFNKLNFDYDVALIRIGSRMKRGKNNKFVVDESFPDKFSFSRFIRPVCLPCMKKGPLSSIDIWKNFDSEKCNPRGKSIFSAIAAVGSTVMVTGFGMKTDHGEHFQYQPDHLQEGLLKIVDALKCAASVKDIQRHSASARFTNRMFCASGVNETARVDSCQGDSGGPIVKSVRLNNRTNYWMQIGIVSWGWKCGGKHPGFYTSVSSIMSWIWKILDDSRIGTWDTWQTWSYCSKTCGGGIRVRYRQCMTKNCQGPRSNSGRCNIARCPPAIQCPSVTPPKDGTMAKSPRTSFFPVGTTIKFSCNEGKFLSTGPSTIVCERSGKWDNSNKPICKDEWEPWSSWTDCSATCGGVKTKVRKCLRKKDLITTFLGCHGSSMATAKCGEENCPEEKKCGQGNNLCLFGTINVNTNRVGSQFAQLANRFGFGKRR